MYTSARRVMTELAQRRQDKGLRRAVEEFLAGQPPSGWPDDRPIATLNRYVATARFEDVVFAHAARSIGLRPYWPTYLGETFTLCNPEKVSCLRPRVHRAQYQISRQWLVADYERWVGSPLGAIQINGSGLADVHAEVRLCVLDAEIVANCFDVTEWNRRQASRFGATSDSPRLAPHYYQAVLALYVCHGVLFEDFDGGPNVGSGLGEFVSKIVRPAFQAVAQHFGRPPLIIRLPYVEGFLDYPAATAEVFDRHRQTR